jgi:ribosomal protein L7/L12
MADGGPGSGIPPGNTRISRKQMAYITVVLDASNPSPFSDEVNLKAAGVEVAISQVNVPDPTELQSMREEVEALKKEVAELREENATLAEARDNWKGKHAAYVAKCPPSPAYLRDLVTEDVQAGNKIYAIKKIREHTLMGLKEAKDLLDSFLAQS